MYEERQGLSFREIIIQLVLVILFILIMIWLFPTKSYLNDNYVSNEDVSGEIADALDEKLEALYGRLFADNIESMKVAGKDYFTTPRLPQEVGDSVTITLEEMIEKKLILELTDSNNESCNVTESYIKVTKLDDEYLMKIQLTCTDSSDYINVYLGCYDYCETDICEEEPEEEQPETPVTKPDPEPSTPTPDPVVKYLYEYKKETYNEYSNYGDWSEWSTTYKASNNLTQVEIKTEKELVKGEGEWGIIGYDYETRYEYEDVLKYELVEETWISDYTPIYEKVEDSKEVTDRQPAKEVSSGSGYYTDWVFVGYVDSEKTLSDTNTIDYKFVSFNIVDDCDEPCSLTYVSRYEKYTRKWVAAETSYSCSHLSGYKLSGDECVKTTTESSTSEKIVGWEPVYSTKTVKEYYWDKEKVEYTEKVPEYGYVDGESYYIEVKYYRYRTRTQIGFADVIIKWSYSSNDQTLLSEGYYKTGNTKKA